MNTKTSTEARRVFINLANAMADALECPETPAKLAERLGECVNEIAELIAPDYSHSVNVILLRGLASEAA